MSITKPLTMVEKTPFVNPASLYHLETGQKFSEL